MLPWTGVEASFAFDGVSTFTGVGARGACGRVPQDADVRARVGGPVARTRGTPVDDPDPVVGRAATGDVPARLSIPLVVAILVVITAIGLAALPFVELFPAGPPPEEVELGPVSVGEPAGRPLAPVAGEWVVDDAGVGVSAVTPLGFPAQLVADLGSVDGWLAVRAAVVSGGWGVVFRQRGAGDYLWVLAAPPYAALKIGRTDGGVPSDLGVVAPVSVRDGMTLTVAFVGPTLRLLIDGREVGRFTDAADAPGTGVGLLGAERAIGVARWSDFRGGVLPVAPGSGDDGD